MSFPRHGIHSFYRQLFEQENIHHCTRPPQRTSDVTTLPCVTQAKSKIQTVSRRVKINIAYLKTTHYSLLLLFSSVYKDFNNVKVIFFFSQIFVSFLKITVAQFRGRYHGGRRPSSDESFHSPIVIPPSALDKPSIMKRYHRRRTTR